MTFPTITRRAVLGAAAALPFASLAQGTSAFKPNRPVKLISPLLAGGATDAIMRPVAQKLGELWGQQVVVENRAGGGTVIGTQAVLASPPDGYTLGIVISALTINPSLRSDLPYDTLRDVTPVVHIGNVTGAFVAHPSFAPNNVREYLAAARDKPGALSWASLGIGTGGHITGELLHRKAGVQVVHVPFNGSSAAYREVLPGRVPVAFVVLESALPHVKAGKLKLLALTDTRRSKLHPDVPIVAETVPGVGFESVFGIIAPRGTPAEVVQAINADVVRVMADPEVRKRLEEQSVEVAGGPPADFAATIRRNVDYWKAAVKESGAQIN
jgi:tripartite-type tricarboxylate transporter receptor subunit TctC